MELNHAEVKVKSTIPQNKILHIHINHLRNENTICYLYIIKDVLEHKVEEREEFFEVVLQRSSRQEQPSIDNLYIYWTFFFGAKLTLQITLAPTRRQNPDHRRIVKSGENVVYKFGLYPSLALCMFKFRSPPW